MPATPPVARMGGDASGPAMQAAAAAMPVPATGSTVAAPSVVLVLLDCADTLWGWSRLVRGPRALASTPGLRFAKVLGSGHDGGFGLRPSRSRQALFCVFDADASAAAFVDGSAVMAAYRHHARELCTLRLRPTTSRGAWAGFTLPARAPSAPGTGPVAALTRASIRPSRLVPFWRRAPAAQRAIAHASGCRLAVGLGEAPLLRQATFSLWDSVADMDAYARRGAHLEAIQAAQRGAHFVESMFVRFTVLDAQGTWKGRPVA